ncbi:MAG: helix-turn-helix domain-containing protein, partial [Methylobacteriaceae bacterium]|nr:helix-turn-helix domain-containing protein [Methylobacteriaceae bacterium]
MARRYDLRRIKIHRNYSVPEVVKLLGVHKHTVSRWIARGLPLIDRRRPFLIHGADLRAFLMASQPAKQPLRPGQIYCLRCRAAKCPAGDIADLVPRSPTSGALIGICPTCDGMMYRAVKLAAVDRARGNVEVALQKAQ